jgi:hypothetical protein
MSSKLATLAAAISMAIAATTVSAAGLEDIFSVRGYATLGVAHSDEDQADFSGNSLTQPQGAGFSDEYSFDVDSKFGAQLDINITPRLAAVVQLVSESNGNNSYNGDANKEYRPSVEWANLSYRATDNLTLRAGRIVLPFLMVSEYRKVGFAHHWLRAPVEIYGQVPFASSDGADLSYRSNLGQGTNTARVHYGVQSLRSTLIESQVQVGGINDTWERGALMVRGAYANIHFKAPGAGFSGLIDPFVAATTSLPGGIGANAATAAARLADQYDPTLGQEIDLYDIGASYDPGRWFAMAEGLYQTSEGLLGATSAGYVSAGFRWNKLTPYATVAFAKTHDRNESGVPLAGLPPPLAGLGGAINGVIGSFTTAIHSQTSLSLGLRWDFATKFALKGQYDYIDLDRGSTGLLSNVQPGFVPGGSLNVISIAVDYVF